MIVRSVVGALEAERISEKGGEAYESAALERGVHAPVRLPELSQSGGTP